MILPNFIILGAAKAGTTALYHYLRQHPEIGMSRIKETNYLALKGHPLDFQGPGDADYIKRFSVTTADGYRDQFLDCGGKKAVGEASPLYLYHPDAPAAIRATVPEARLIAILRNPVDRAFSAFLHLVRDGRETTRDFAEALRLEPERIAAHWEHIWHYVGMGRYAEQLERYYAMFPREQIKVIVYRDFRTDPVGVMRDIYRFLDVDDAFQADQTTRHNSGLPPELRPELHADARDFIRHALAADTARLPALIGHDLTHWNMAGA